MNPCIKFFVGKCKYGDRCNFTHPKQDQEQEQESKQDQDQCQYQEPQEELENEIDYEELQKEAEAFLKDKKIRKYLPQIRDQLKNYVVTDIHAATGTGKSVGVPVDILVNSILNPDDSTFNKHQMFVSCPTVTNTRGLYDYVTKNMPTIAHLIARSAGGQRTENYETSRVAYVTTQTLVNRLCKLLRSADKGNTAANDALNHMIVMNDEAHHPSVETYMLHGLCNYIVKQNQYSGFKVIMSTATPIKHIGDHLRVSKERTVVVESTQFPITTEFIPVGSSSPVSYDPIANTTKIDSQLMNEWIVTRISSELESNALIPTDGILIFVPGEQEIYDTIDMLTKHFGSEEKGPFIFHPLHSSLGADALEQAKTFSDPNMMNCYVATPVVQTGTTIRNMRVVINTCLHKVSRNTSAGTKIMTTEAISQSASIQRRGRTGREQRLQPDGEQEPGRCYVLMTEKEWNKLPVHEPSQFENCNKEIPMLQLLTTGLDAQEILCIPDGEYEEIIQRMIVFGLIDADCHVTNMGKEIEKFSCITSIRLGIALLSAIKENPVKQADYNRQTDAFMDLLLALIAVVVAETNLASPHVLKFPHECIRDRGAKLDFVEENISSDFKKTDEISCLIAIFLQAMSDCWSDKQEDVDYRNFKEWACENHISMQFLKTAKQLLFTVWTNTFRNVNNPSLKLQYVWQTLSGQIEERKDKLYVLFARVFADRHMMCYDDKYALINKNGNCCFVNSAVASKPSLATMWTNEEDHKYIVALSGTEFKPQKGRSITFLNLCFPMPRDAVLKHQARLAQFKKECDIVDDDSDDAGW